MSGPDEIDDWEDSYSPDGERPDLPDTFDPEEIEAAAWTASLENTL